MAHKGRERKENKRVALLARPFERVAALQFQRGGAALALKSTRAERAADYSLAGASGVQQTGRACAALGAVNKESSSGDFLTSLSGFEVPVDS